MTYIFDCENHKVDIDAFDEYTGRDEWYAVYTIQLGELVQKGVFDWSRNVLDWKSAAYDEEQYTRICDYFIQRFYYREISIEPFAEWAVMLKRKLVYELMPKYKPLYERIAEGVNPLADSSEYYKDRTISSAYPETLLSGNADYITDGKDQEFERIKEGNIVDSLEAFEERYKGIDEMMLDELESMFISMYTLNMNSIW